jgi:hypothetical protein
MHEKLNKYCSNMMKYWSQKKILAAIPGTLCIAV